MEKSPSWEANSRSASQEMTLHYHFNKIPPLVSILRQMNLVHTFSPYFLMIDSNIILHFYVYVFRMVSPKVKVNLSLCFKCALRHGGVLEERRYSAIHIWPRQ
jgi:hypothetical protein